MIVSAKQAVNAARDSTALSDIVTGGDSWGYVEITQPANTPPNCRLFFVVNDGKKYPLRNVSLIVVQNNGYMQYRIGDIAPNDICPSSQWSALSNGGSGARLLFGYIGEQWARKRNPAIKTGLFVFEKRN